MKIYLFRSQINLTAQELSAHWVFNVFVLEVYIKYWYTSSSGKLAPYNDLNLLKELDSYKISNKVISDTGTKSFSKHLWYLSETLIRLAFIDSRVPTKIKDNMVKSLVKKELTSLYGLLQLKRLEFKRCNCATLFLKFKMYQIFK